MSGGHWGYRQFDLEEQAQEFTTLLRLYPYMEHELDWGHSCDTCLACAERRVAKTVSRVLDKASFDECLAILTASYPAFLCDRCQERHETNPRPTNRVNTDR